MLVLTSIAKKQNFEPVPIPGTQPEGEEEPLLLCLQFRPGCRNIATKILEYGTWDKVVKYQKNVFFRLKINYKSN